MLREVEHHIAVLRLTLLLVNLDEFFLNQVHDKFDQIVDLDQARGILIVLGPLLAEEGPRRVCNSGFLLLSSLQLTFKDDCNEEIEED